MVFDVILIIYLTLCEKQKILLFQIIKKFAVDLGYNHLS